MPSVESVLRAARERYRAVFYRPHLGNAGDALIHEGFYDLAARLGLRYAEITGGRTATPEAGADDVIVMGGGGSLSSHWGFGAADLTALTGSAASLILLPQSLDGPVEALHTLRPTDTLFVRDRYTLEIARSMDLQCEIHLDHDMALHLDPARVLAEGRVRVPRSLDEARRTAAFVQHRLRARRGETLYAWRKDAEASGERQDTRRRDDVPILANYGTTDAASNHESARALLSVLGRYRAVETDRLHVGIGTALMGRPVRLHSNNYHKIRGVYEYSLATNPRLASLVTYVGPGASPGPDHRQTGSPLRGTRGQETVQKHRKDRHKPGAQQTDRAPR